MKLDELKKKNIHVIGISGAESSAVLEFLHDNKIGVSITAHDFCEEEEFKEKFFSFHDAMSLGEKEEMYKKLKDYNIKFNFGGKYLAEIEKADIIFAPQSWFRYPQNEPLKLLSKKIEFCNITKLYFNLCPCKIIAITGTSGKSTTSALIYEIVKRGYKNGEVYFSGNDRENIQVLKDIFKIKENDVLILEVSNRQLMIDFKRSPYIGVITNITPNHLDDHKSFLDYIKVKKKLLRYQKNTDFAVLNYDNELTKDISLEVKSQVYNFSRKEKVERGSFVSSGKIIILDKGHEYRICSIYDLKIPGPHNIENVLAASLVSYLFGISTKSIREAVLGFSGIKSRLEFIRESKGVKYYEDSSACNPDGTAVAAQSFKAPILLIAGGSRKKPYPGEFDRMADSIINSKTKAMFLIGERAATIKEAIKNSCVKSQVPGPIVKMCENLEVAVKSAAKSAVKGDVVILSPGCESFGMFIDYRDRARQYKRLVEELV